MDFFANLYGIATMMDNYEERKVANDEREEFVLDTAKVTDRRWLYETAVMHKKFNNNDWIILDGANDLEDAKSMHEKWLKFFEEKTPDFLTDYWSGEIFDSSDIEDEEE